MKPMYRLAGVWILLLTAPVWARDAEHRPLKQVIVVFKTHFDIGYTDYARGVLEYYRTDMMDKALEVCDRNRDLPADQQFTWTLSAWPTWQILGPQQSDARRTRIEQAFADGHFVFHALPATLHTESLDLEDIVRGLRFGHLLAERFDQPLPRDGKMTDVPSHVRSLATILPHAGIDFLHIGTNGAVTPPGTPLLFWWVGPDGSKLLTMLVGGYGTGLLPPADWPHETWLALILTGDNVGPPPPERVREVLAELEKSAPGVKVRLGRMSDFADAIMQENPDLPELRADMPDTWIHGIMSMPIETAIARRVRPEIRAVESLNTLLRAGGAAVPDIAELLNEAYERSLMYGEHTWGIDAKRYERVYGEKWKTARIEGKYKDHEASWAEHGDYIRRTQELIEPTLVKQMHMLAESVQVEGDRVVVYNPLPWRRDGVVRFEANPNLAHALIDEDGQKPLPIERDGKQMVFVARDLPPMGYKTYTPVESGQAGCDIDDGNILENHYLKVVVDRRRGGIVSIIDKKSDKELVRPQADEVAGAYLYERFDKDDGDGYYKAYVPTQFHNTWWAAGDFNKPNLPPAGKIGHLDARPGFARIERTRGPVAQRIVLSEPIMDNHEQQVTLTYCLYNDHPYLDITWSIRNKQADPWPEAGWLCLPLNIDRPTFRLGRLGTIVDPATELVPASNHDVFCLNTGMAVVGPDGYGIGICPLEAPLVSLEDRGVFQFRPEFVADRANVYVNLFNNVWGTNFQQWIEGSWSARVRLWAIGQSYRDDKMIVPSLEARYNCVAATAGGPGGQLPAQSTGVSVSRPGIMTTAFGPNPFGRGTILRLWETAGSGGTCTVTLPPAMKIEQLQPCNLRGKIEGDPIKPTNGRFDLNIKPFAPASFIIE